MNVIPGDRARPTGFILVYLNVKFSLCLHKQFSPAEASVPFTHTKRTKKVKAEHTSSRLPAHPAVGFGPSFTNLHMTELVALVRSLTYRKYPMKVSFPSGRGPEKNYREYGK